MKNLKGVVAGYASKVQRSQVCCNSTGLMERWMNPPDDGPCCADFSSNPPSMTPTFDDLFTGEARSGEWVVPAIDCPVEIRITSTVSNTPIAGETLQLKLIVNGGNAVPLIPVNGSATFTVQAGDQLNLDAQTNLTGAEYCHDITFNIFNVTCGVNYPNVTQVFLNGTPDCVSCPWMIESIETSGRTYLFAPYVNTTPQVITYDFVAINTITFNAGTNIRAYYGADPVYSNNPFVQIIVSGVDAGLPQSASINPGETIWIYCDNATNGLLTKYEIGLQVNGNCGLIGNVTIEVTLNK